MTRKATFAGVCLLAVQACSRDDAEAQRYRPPARIAAQSTKAGERAVSLAELIPNASRWNGKTLSAVGYLVFQSELTGLYLTSEYGARRIQPYSVAVTLGDCRTGAGPSTHSVDFALVANHYVAIQGTFIADPEPTGADPVGELCDITKVTSLEVTPPEQVPPSDVPTPR